MKDLDTLYEASEQQLSVLPTESREGASSIESMTADLTKTAKLLPELRVSRTVPTPQASLTWCVCVFQKVEMFGRCQDILRRCENMAKQTGVATRNTLVQLYTSITKTWDMARQSQQLSQVQLLILFSLSPTSHTHTLPTAVSAVRGAPHQTAASCQSYSCDLRDLQRCSPLVSIPSQQCSSCSGPASWLATPSSLHPLSTLPKLPVSPLSTNTTTSGMSNSSSLLGGMSISIHVN